MKMPIVKSIAIHDNVRATLRYILNPQKTEGLFLCNSLNCFTNAEDAYLNMKYIYENYTHHKFNELLPAVGKRRVKAIHYIQSFKPDPNLTPELVHRMGCAFIRKAFGDNVQVVIATHIDKAHYHNHILINTYGIDGHKYNDNYTTRRTIRKHSDLVCLAFDIPVTEAKRKRGLSYCEWKHRKHGTSWKEKIRREIDTLVLTSKNFDELVATLEQRGYDNCQELEDKPDKSLAEKMKLSLARQSLARHGINCPEDMRQLEIQKQEYDDRIAEIQRTIDDKDYLVRALREIAATYLDISYGDYISKLIIEKKEQQETLPENPVQEKTVQTQVQSVPVQKRDEPKPITSEPAQKQNEPTQENPAQKQTAQETHRRKKSR